MGGITWGLASGQTGFENQSDGFRIKEQFSKSSDADKAQITDYYYTDNFPELDPALASKNISTGIKTRDILTKRIDNASSIDPFDHRLYTFYMDKKTDYDCSYPSELPNSTIKSPQLGYSSVWVLQSKEGESIAKSSLGYKNYKFTNYITAIKNDDGSLTYIQNNSNVAGKIISNVSYNAKKQEVNRIEYEYKKGPEITMVRYYFKTVTYKDIRSQTGSNTWAEAYNTKYSRYNLSNKTVTNYNFFTSTDYTFDDVTNNLIKMSVEEPSINYASLPSGTNSENLTDADLNITTTTYRYIVDFASKVNINLNTPHQIKNLPIETVVRKNGNVISAEFTNYNTTLTTNLNRSYYLVRPYQIYTLDISSPITNFTPTTSDWNIADTRYKLKTTYDLYDSNGNLLEYHNEGSAHGTFYYDNLYQFPLIEVKNCTYNAFNTVNAGLDQTKPTDLLRLRKLLPNAQITSYTNDPKFGITSVTTPNGVTTYKEYDVFGRLMDIKDNSGKILQTKEYNYNIQ
jgi:hypothetical protein